MVIASATQNLLVPAITQTLADGVRFSEIKRRAGYFANLSGRDHGLIGWGERIGMQSQTMRHDIGVARFTCEIEIAVVREIDDGGLVRRGAVFNGQLVLVSQCVDCMGG